MEGHTLYIRTGSANQCICWGFTSSGMWCCTITWMVSSVWKALCSFKPLGITQTATQCRIPEDVNQKHHWCEKFKSCRSYVSYTYALDQLIRTMLHVYIGITNQNITLPPTPLVTRSIEWQSDDPNSFSLKIPTVMFTKMLENLHSSMWPHPKSLSSALSTSHASPRFRICHT